MLSVVSEDVYYADEEVFKCISLSAESEIELCVTGCLLFTTSPVIPYPSTIFYIYTYIYSPLYQIVVKGVALNFQPGFWSIFLCVWVPVCCL